MDMNYSLLENGLDFILDATQKLSELNDSDLDNKDNQRLIKYALLHLSAGIELVFKYRLFKEHWTYVFADMNKANKKGLSSGDFSSVDSKTSIDRLESLCDIAFDEQEKKDLQKLRNRRNRAEHFSLNEPLKAVEVSMHKSISIITKFLVNHCNTDEFQEEETSLFEDIKRQLREMEQHYADAKAIAERQVSDMNMTGLTITCPACGEKFLIRDDRRRPFHATGRRCSCSDNGVNPSFCSTMANFLKYRSRIISEYLLLGERPFSFAGKTKKAPV